MRQHSRVRRTPFLRRHPLATAIGCMAFLADPPATARTEGGADVPVLNCDDSGPGSLRDVIAHAANGDHVVFPADIGCDLVALTSGPIVIANDVGGQPFTQLDISGPGRDTLTIDGGGLGRVFVHDAGPVASLQLSGFKVTHGRSDTSGGCINAAGSVTLQDVEVSDCIAGVVSGDATLGNAAVRGGAVYAGAAALLYGSVVQSNHVYGGAAYAYGGGVFAVNAIAATTSMISGNTSESVGGASYGGGLAAGDVAARVQAVLTLISSTVTGNTAHSGCNFCGSRGGGAWAYGNADLTDGDLTENTVSSSYGYGAGGGLYFNARYSASPVNANVAGTHFHCNTADTGGGIAAGGDLSVSHATIDCNSAMQDGAGIELVGGNLALTDTALVGNVALGRGGGAFMFGYGEATITNSTISGNIAANGAGIGNTYGAVHIANSTITQNTASEHGGGVYFRYAYYPFTLTSSIVAGNVGNQVADDLWPPGMTVTGSNDLVTAAPGVELPPDTLGDDPMLLPLADNGGGTLTHALGEGSPAIDAGINPAALAFDQRGEGFVRVFGAAADIGAFEVQPVTPDIVFRNGFDP